MTRFTPWMLAPLVSLAVLSCAGKSGNKPQASGGYKPLSQRINETGGYKQDAEGNWVPRSNKRSPYDNVGRSPYFKGTRTEKQLKPGEYQKKSWWGNRDFRIGEYQGNTDGSRFQKSSSMQGSSARESNNAANLPGDYATNSYATSAAREAAQRGITTTSDAETDVRRRVYQQPEVINWREQRPITRGETKSLLGR